MGLLLFYLFLALSFSFLCSIMEAVLLSVNPSFIATLESQGRKSGVTLRKLKKDVDKPLAAILSLNTIAHTVGAAGVGAQAQLLYGSEFVGLSSAIITFLILVFSEIIPKSLGAMYWRTIAPYIAIMIHWLTLILYPFVLLSKGITQFFARKTNEPSISREEFTAMADIGAAEGVIDKGESEIFKNLVALRSLQVRDIMTPRIVVTAFSDALALEEVEDQVKELRFSRIPLYQKRGDDITGYILKTDVLLALMRGEKKKKLSELKRDMLHVPETLNLYLLFDRLIKSQEHIAAVVDEYGGFAGVVTMEDLVETLLGMEIVDESDNIEDMQALARKRWLERARKLGIPVEEIGRGRWD